MVRNEADPRQRHFSKGDRPAPAPASAEHDADKSDTGRVRLVFRPFRAAFEWGNRCKTNLTENPHGGDFPQRFDLALRHALGSSLFFTLLVYTPQNKMEAIWLGNLFVQFVILKGTFGAAIPCAIKLSRDIALTTGLCWSVNLLLQSTGPRAFSILLPFATCVLTFTFMMSPYFYARNQMLVIMIVILPLNLHGDDGLWFPLGLMGTCCVGTWTSVFVTLLPLPRPAMATIVVRKLLRHVEQDSETLLNGMKLFSSTCGTCSSQSRQAVSFVDLAVERLAASSKDLKGHANASEIERRFLMCKYDGHALVRWSELVAEQQTHCNLIRIAMSQRLLGEEFTAYSDSIREAEEALGVGLENAVDTLVSTAITVIEFCTLSVDLGRAPSAAAKDQLERQLKTALHGCHVAWGSALPEVDAILLSAQRSSGPSLAFLIRRLELAYGVYELCANLSSFLESGYVHRPPTRRSTWQQLRGYVTQPWSCNDFRLPLKAAVGMALASLWIAIPALYEKAEPFASWPAITVASVNLASTGSSYIKCVDRLWGTLTASGFVLTLSFLSGEESFENNNVKIPSLGLFTFLAIYLRNPERPYAGECAAATVGFILYGSVKNDFDVSGYVLMRVVLIFVGVITFMIVEMLLFPRSSRKVVQEQCLKFLYDTNGFLEQATVAMRAVKCHHALSEKTDEESVRITCVVNEERKEEACTDTNVTSSDDHSRATLTSKNCDKSNLEELKICHFDAHQSIRIARKEFRSALNEPVLGFGLPFHEPSWTGMLTEEEVIEGNMKLILDAIEFMQNFYVQEKLEGHPIRCMGWPSLYADMVEDAANQLAICCSQMKEAFPDGTIRPQKENVVKAVKAAASFRDFDDVRLNIVALWSKRYHFFLELKDLLDSALITGNQSLMMIVTFGMATSVILGTCRRLQKAGSMLELMTHAFPRVSPAAMAHKTNTLSNENTSRNR